MFADGAGTDNLAILPALRRGCRKLIISDANGDNPDEGYFDHDIKSYFGRAVEGDDYFNLNAQVFEGSAWDDLWDDIKAKAKAGAALSCETAACIKGVAGSDPDAATEALVECVIAQGCVTSASLRGSVRVE